MLGSRLGRWVLDRELGRGAMGGVWRAHADDDPNERRAVKILAPELVREPTFRQRFEREIELLRELNHPNIVRLFESGLHEGVPYFVMEYVDGRDCEARLRDEGRLPWQEVLDVAIQITSALKHAHDKGVIHRDLKPANVLVADGAVKLTDFGVARALDRQPLTLDGNFVGTAAFLAPEQAAGKPATKRSDFYALGGVMYALLTGRPPFLGDSAAALMHQHQFAQPDRPARYVEGLPHDVDELVCHLLAKEPSGRPGDGSVLLKQLERVRNKLQRRADAADGPDLFRSREEGRLRAPALTPTQEPAARPARYQFWVLLPLFLLCVGLIVYGLTRPRPGAEDLYRQAEPLMQSADPADWQRAWDDHLERLVNRYPDHPRARDAQEFRRKLGLAATQKQLIDSAKRAGPPSEGQRLYHRGLRAIQAGDTDEGRRVWRNLVAAFDGVESERPWVELARHGIDDVGKPADESERLKPVRDALEHARQLQADGQPEQAEAVRRGLEELYRGDPAAAAVLAEIRRDREKK
jgi:eukaryotic-like serine/threonine-protein kinase